MSVVNLERLCEQIRSNKIKNFDCQDVLWFRTVDEVDQLLLALKTNRTVQSLPSLDFSRLVARPPQEFFKYLRNSLSLKSLSLKELKHGLGVNAENVYPDIVRSFFISVAENPRIESLSTDVTIDTEPALIAALMGMDSLCTLKLELVHSVQTKSLISVIQNLPSLRGLGLTSANAKTDLVMANILRPFASKSKPQLQKLWLRPYDHHEATTSAVFGILASPGCSIESLSLEGNGWDSGIASRGLDPLVTIVDGLTVNHTVTDLCLLDCSLSSAVCRLLKGFLISTTTLRNLQLQGVTAGEEVRNEFFWMTIAIGISCSKSLTGLELRGGFGDMDMELYVQDLMDQNKTLERFKLGDRVLSRQPWVV